MTDATGNTVIYWNLDCLRDRTTEDLVKWRRERAAASREAAADVASADAEIKRRARRSIP